MKEVKGDLFTFKPEGEFSQIFRVITTNGFVKANGECVMGRGCALEAKRLHPNLPFDLGFDIRNSGNNVYYYRRYGNIITFPVKHYWWEEADLNLIDRSCNQLACFALSYEDAAFVMPRPGCGNGKLKWDDVKEILERYLDDRFFVIDYDRK